MSKAASRPNSPSSADTSGRISYRQARRERRDHPAARVAKKTEGARADACCRVGAARDDDREPSESSRHAAHAPMDSPEEEKDNLPF
jgi:hypothetical protein